MLFHLRCSRDRCVAAGFPFTPLRTLVSLYFEKDCHGTVLCVPHGSCYLIIQSPKRPCVARSFRDKSLSRDVSAVMQTRGSSFRLLPSLVLENDHELKRILT